MTSPMIYVCTTCKRAGEPDSDPRPGALLAEATERAADGTEVDGAPAALPRQLHARAERRDALQRLLDLCVRRPRCARMRRRWSTAQSSSPPPTDGILPWRGRPDILKRGLIARVPPIDFSEADA